MAKFRKKPVVIEAVQWDGTTEGAAGVIDFSLGVCIFSKGHMAINTLEGLMTVSPGDWVIRGVKNEFYPCKPDIFEATYEAVSD